MTLEPGIRWFNAPTFPEVERLLSGRDHECILQWFPEPAPVDSVSELRARRGAASYMTPYQRQGPPLCSIPSTARALTSSQPPSVVLTRIGRGLLILNWEKRKHD